MVHITSRKLFHKNRTTVGALPGEIGVHENEQPTRVRIIRQRAEEFEERDMAPGEDLRALVEPGRTLWVDVRGLADSDVIQRIGETFGLSSLTIADVINIGQRPKCEDLEHALLIIARMVTFDEGRRLRWEQVSLVVGDGFLLTFQETYVDCFEPTRERIRNGVPMVRGARADLLSVLLLDAIVDGYFPVIEDFGDQLEEIETIVLHRPSPSVLSDIYRVKRELGQFRRAAWPLRDALSRSLSDRTDIVSPATMPYLHDVRDHIVQVVDVLESYRELAGSLIDVYLSSVSNRTNEVMRVLTIIATIFIPLGFLAGVYGMNFDTSKPGNLPELQWPHGYRFFWITAGVIAFGLLAMFWKLGWLRGAGGDDD